MSEDAARQGVDIDAPALARIEADIDAGIAEWMRQGKRAANTHKLTQVRGLLLNARRYNQLRQQRTPASLPYSELTPGNRVRAAAQESVGATCANPLDLVPGAPLATALAASGEKGDSVWVRLTASAADRRALSTLGSQGDTDIAAFASCEESQPLLANDDFYGLQALAILSAPQRTVYRVRVSNRDASRPVQARIEVTLAAGFSGKITVDPLGTASVAGLTVANFSTISGYYNGTTYTDAAGTYTMLVNGDGTYYARTGAYPQGSILHEAFGGVPCTSADYYSLYSCTPGQPAPIVVASSQVTAGIDFELGLGRALTFRLTNEASGSALTSGSVSLNSAAGTVGSGYADSSGRVTFLGLRTGVAYHAWSSAEGFRAEAFDNIPCSPYCQTGQGTPISFEPTDPYFREHLVALTPVRRLVVHVRDLPQAPYSAVVNLLYPSGQIASSASAYYSNMLPGWRSVVFPEPATGSFYLQGGYTDSSFWRLHPNVDCLTDCQSLFSQAQPIVISTGTQTQEYFLDPRPFPSIHGSVVDQIGGNPVTNATAHLLPLSGGSQSTVNVGSTGEYRFNYARPGTYLVAIASSEHVDVAYPDAPCTGSGYSLVCATATPVTISSAASAFQFNFNLEPSGRISGSLTMDGAPITHTIQLRLRRSDGSVVQGAMQTGVGTYNLTDLPPGSYRAVVEDSAYAYGQVFPGIDCAGGGCTSTSAGELLAVNATPLSNINFDLRMQRGGKGQVLDARTGQPLSGVVVDMWATDASGNSYVRSGLTAANGRFAIPAQDSYSSAYRLATSSSGSYINEVYNNVQCPVGPAYLGLCDLTQGDVIPAVQPINGQGVSFRLTPANADALFADGMEE